jgi:hypothetical protein
MYWNDLFGLSRNIDAMQHALSAESLARSADTEMRFLRSTVEQLADACNRLMLLNRAMWELLQKRTGASEAELLDVINELDLRDGVLDGKLQPSRVCSKCNRVLSKRSRRCLYCGAEADDADPFRGV